jgi:acyl-CoA dehydrogenase
MFNLTARAQELHDRLRQFIEAEVTPAEDRYFEHISDPDRRFSIPPVMEELKVRARALGLWNLFMPDSRYGAGLSNLDYAPLAELMGRSILASEACNCAAPDSGNMEVLAVYGSETQKEKWLHPLLRGEMRSAFAMTEPDVASSDATNIATTIDRDDDHYIIHGRKWWTSGALDPRCGVFIVMGVSNPLADTHQRHSMILVPRDSAGVHLVRPLHVFGYDDAPHGHAEVMFDTVRIPAENLIYGEGKGFEIAQGRLGPGRIHHCMRLIGLAERALESMIERARTRVAFGRPLAGHGMAQEAIARSRCDIEQARLLTLSAAEMIDRLGNRKARSHIAMIKIVAPQMACNVIDRAIQMHGGFGLCQDSFLPAAYAAARSLRLADGPDEVHLMTLARQMCEG